MKQLNEKEKIELLKNLPNKVVDMANLRRYNFADIVGNAENNGLLYMAERINPTMKLLKLPTKDGVTKEDGPNVFTFEDKDYSNRKLKVTIGDDAFLKFFVADAYIGNNCGCFYGSFKRFKEDIPFELLKYGHIFYTVTSIDCGRDFPGVAAREVLATEHDDLYRKDVQQELLKRFLGLHMGNKVSMIRKKVAEICEIPKGLEQRLHIIPSM